MIDLGTCQCPRDPDNGGSCPARPTAEDLLCDTCRKGCGFVTLRIGDGEPVTTNHVEINWEGIQLAIGGTA